MNEILKELSLIGLIPVTTVEKSDDAVEISRTLAENGISCIEITLRTEAGLDSIKSIAENCPGVVVGAGTVLTVQQVEQVMERGAKFIVSPGLNPDVVSYCIDNDILVIPGVATPSDIEKALSLGIDTVKLFPAEALGGVKYLKAVVAPYQNILKLVPTGGLNTQNYLEYLNIPQVIACGGSWLTPSDAIKEKNYHKMANLANMAIKQILGFKLHHVGLNHASEESAKKASDFFASLFDFAVHDGTGSFMLASQFEFMKSKFAGDNGHIAIGTNSIPRAVYYLNKKGIQIVPDKQIVKNGKLISVYLDMSISGFAVHLVQN